VADSDITSLSQENERLQRELTNARLDLVLTDPPRSERPLTMWQAWSVVVSKMDAQTVLYVAAGIAVLALMIFASIVLPTPVHPH
jgi:hypothetical protein